MTSRDDLGWPNPVDMFSSAAPTSEGTCELPLLNSGEDHGLYRSQLLCPFACLQSNSLRHVEGLLDLEELVLKEPSSIAEVGDLLVLTLLSYSLQLEEKGEPMTGYSHSRNEFSLFSTLSEFPVSEP